MQKSYGYNPDFFFVMLRTFLDVLIFFIGLALMVDYFPLIISKRRKSADLFFLVFLSSFFASLSLRKHLSSIFQMPKSGCSNIFISILTTFLIASSQKSNSWLQIFNYAQINGFRFSQRYEIKISSLEAVKGSNSL